MVDQAAIRNLLLKPHDVVITSTTEPVNMVEGYVRKDGLSHPVNSIGIIKAEDLRDPQKISRILPALRTEIDGRLEAIKAKSPSERDSLTDMLEEAYKASKIKLDNPDFEAELIKGARAATDRCETKTSSFHQEEFLNRIMRSNGPFTELFRRLFVAKPVAIVTASTLGDFSSDKSARKAMSMVNVLGDYVVISHKMIDALKQRDEWGFCEALWSVGYNTLWPTAQRSVPDRAQSELTAALQKEFGTKQDINHMSEVQALSLIHNWLYDGKHTEAQLRREVPMCMAYYDRTIKQLTQKVEELEAQRALGQSAIPEPLPQPSSTQAYPIFEDYKPANLETLLQKANEFARIGLEQVPPFCMVRCNLDASLERRNPVNIFMSRWVRPEADAPLRVENNYLSLRTNEPDLGRALHTMQVIRSHLLNTPGLIPYRNIKDGRIVVGDDDIIPLEAPANGGGRGDLVKRDGIFKLHLKFSENGAPLDITISLGLRQDEGNRSEAQQRAALVMDRLQHLHAQTPPMRITRGEMGDWLRQQIPLAQWQQPEQLALEEIPHVTNVNYPNRSRFDQTTTLVVDNPVRAGSPTESWKVPVRICVNSQTVKTQHFNLHTLDHDLARERVRIVLENLQQGLEQRDRNGRWHLDNQGGLMTIQSEAARAALPDMDTTRLEDICTDAERHGPQRRFVMCHHVDIAGRRSPVDGRTTIDLSVRKNNSRSPMNEWFMETRGTSIPIRVERPVSVPEDGGVSVAALHRAVDSWFQRGLYALYETHSNPDYERDGIAKRSAPLEFNQRTLPNLLEDAIVAAMRRGAVEGAAPEFDLPSRRRSAAGFYLDLGESSERSQGRA